MRLSLILFLLGLKLRWTVWRDDGLRRRLRRLDRVVVIRTADGRRARSYVFRDGGVHSHAGAMSQATAELVWSDAATALKIMLSGSTLQNFSALGRGDLVIKGNLLHALWFTDLVS